MNPDRRAPCTKTARITSVSTNKIGGWRLRGTAFVEGFIYTITGAIAALLLRLSDLPISTGNAAMASKLRASRIDRVEHREIIVKMGGNGQMARHLILLLIQPILDAPQMILRPIASSTGR
jgi:hypothetical protein